MPTIHGIQLIKDPVTGKIPVPDWLTEIKMPFSTPTMETSVPITQTVIGANDEIIEIL